MKVLVTAATFFLALQFSFAQTLTDSLLQEISKTTSDSLLAHLHREVGVALKKAGKPEQAIEQYPADPVAAAEVLTHENNYHRPPAA